ncbi:hypothetical protein [Mucilaginibacter psychrotolerans]|uniref:Fibronectin type-III domain-containing protein n=1 Tax=Mucilaginibacter psychrotolerans TaxID=1524096 RepID=A0A4Y8SJH3_9SPHI|nr:hypothetical protein [Mucilaginibacter psychrotolerans]TFF38546.1 hypothetical protein E2R66_08765 [Mucilaginibacter psychrotolerans]
MKKIAEFLCLWSIFALAGCTKKESPAQPVTPIVVSPVAKDSLTVVVDSISKITIVNAVVYARVTGKAGSAVTDRGVCWGITANPQITDSVAKASTVNGNGTFQASINKLIHNTTYHVRSFISGGGKVVYSNDITFKTITEPAPVVTTDTASLAGATIAFVKGSINSATTIKESGVLISENPIPSAGDRKVLNVKDERAFLMRINDLKPSTIYYYRAFATTAMGITGYGAVVKFTTVQMGNLTYSFYEDPSAADDVKAANKRIKASLDQAVYLYNNFTPIVKHLNVSYSPGTPTADASFDGSIRVGANASYQRTGTILHEIAHTLGVGQHWMWGVLIQNGVYQGKNALFALRFLTCDANAGMYGDGLHFWPFGINGAFEDSGDEMLYITNVMVVSAMRLDGLPSN